MESKLSGKMVMSEKTEKRVTMTNKRVTMTEKENKTTKVIGKRSRPEKIDGVVMIKKGDHSLDQYLGSYLKEGKNSKISDMYKHIKAERLIVLYWKHNLENCHFYSSLPRGI